MKRIVAFCVGVLFLFGIPDRLTANEGNVIIRSVEWLVDNSDAIIIVDDADSATPVVVHALKGSKADIIFPLSTYEPSSNRYYYSSDGGAKRVLFVRKKNELLGKIDLARSRLNPNVRRTVEGDFFGFTQYGEPIGSSSDLFRLILKRARINPGPMLQTRKEVTQTKDNKGVFVAVPTSFPLDTRETKHILEVPFTAERKQHYLASIQESSYAPEIYESIRQLSDFAPDVSIRNALELVQQKKDLIPGFVETGWNEFKLVNQKELRQFASKHLADATQAKK